MTQTVAFKVAHQKNTYDIELSPQATVAGIHFDFELLIEKPFRD
jgi:hypothetical protein